MFCIFFQIHSQLSAQKWVLQLFSTLELQICLLSLVFCLESDRHWVLVAQESVTIRIAVICAVLDIREIEILNDTNKITPPLWKEVIVVLYSSAFTIFRSCFSKIFPHVLLPLLLNFVNREHNYEKRTSGWLKAYSEKSFRPWIKILEEFYATVLTKDGADYKLDGFYVMVTVVDWYLIEKE